MTLPTIVLNWHRCPDGIEVGDLLQPVTGRAGTIYRDLNSGRRFRFKSSRREKITQNNNFESPVVVRFINATSEEALIRFFARFGLPLGGDETLVESEFQQQSDLAAALERATSGDSGLAGPAIAGLLEQIRLRPAFDFSGKGQSARLALRSPNLLGFMSMEIALLGAAGARFGRCEECGEVFLTGPMTERRSTAKFCKDRCRQRSRRRHKKG